MELSIEQFNPAAAELSSLVAQSKGIVVTDFSDKAALAIVKEKRINLKKARVSIEKRGKELREEANAFNKAVIAKQNELIGIIEPEEIRLSQIEEAAEQHAIMEERKRKFPLRAERLDAIGEIVENEDQINAMDDVAFEAYMNVKIAAKHERDAEKVRKAQEAKQAELDAKEAKLKEAERAVARERELAEATERARQEGEAKAKAEQERKEAAERAEAERKEVEAKAAIAKLEKSKKYQEFLESVGYAETSDFQRTETPTEVIIWKKIGTFKK